MAAFAVGDVGLVKFPFSDLSHAKLRPAIVLAAAEKGDWILCQVTSNPFGDSQAIEITEQDLAQGFLQKVSYARPAKLFTANLRIIVRKVGSLKAQKRHQLIRSVKALFQHD